MADIYSSDTNKFGNAVGLPFSSFATEESGMLDLGFSAHDITRMNDMFWLDGIRQDSGDWVNGDGAVRWINGFNVAVRPFRGHVNGTIVFADQVVLAIDPEPTSERVDSVIIRRDYTARTVNVEVKKGTSGSTEPPALTYNAFGMAEYALAHIRVTNAMDALSQTDVIDVRTRIVANLGVSPWFYGKIELLPVRASDLAQYAPGWHFCNGDLYPLSSQVGGRLFDLPVNLKADWGITVTGSNISIPNLFHTDGRGYFLRAANEAGNVQDDAIRNISGNVGAVNTPGAPSGVFRSNGGDGRTAAGGTGGMAREIQLFNAADVVPTAGENRPLNRGATPAIFLEV